MATAPKHRVPLVHTFVDDEEIVVAREQMFVDEVKSPFLRSGADFVAVFHKTPIDLLALGLQGFVQWVMALADVQAEEVLCGKVLPAFGATVHMVLGIVDLVVFVCGERDRRRVGWE